MNKRVFSFLLVIFIFVVCFPISARASSVTDVEIEYLEDGAYIESYIVDSTTRASTKTGQRIKNYYNSSGTLEWRIVLTGTFSYDGTSSSCTNSSCSVTVYVDNWYMVSKTATKSGSTAYATVTMGKTYLGVTTSKPTYSLSLSCDKNGNLT